MKVVTCRSCKAAVFFARTKKGKDIPLDATPDPKGNTAIIERADYAGNVVLHAVMRAVDVNQPTLGFEPMYMPHHATCPQGKEWRR